MRDFAASRDITIVGFYSVDAATRLSGIIHAANICLEGGASHILFDEPATFMIETSALINVIDRLASKQCSVAMVSSQTIFSHGHLAAMRDIMLACGREDKNARRKNIKRALLKKKRRGFTLGGKKFGSDEQEKAALGMICEFASSGHSLQKICELLAMNDIKTTHQKKWHPTTVKRIIERQNRSTRRVLPRSESFAGEGATDTSRCS